VHLQPQLRTFKHINSGPTPYSNHQTRAMSGSEVVIAVASIMSTFQASVTLYRIWRDREKQRKMVSQNRALELSLSSGASIVQTEYERDFTRLGLRFAVGDGIISKLLCLKIANLTIDVERAELSQYIIQLQHAIITHLSQSNTVTSIVLPKLSTMLDSSNDI